MKRILFIIYLITVVPYLSAVTVSTAAQLETAVENANNGGDTTIVVRAGTYTLSGALGVWANGLTVRGETGNRGDVKIYGQGMTGGVSHIFNVAGTAFTAKDMTIGRVSTHAIQIWGNNSSSDTVLSNLHIVDCYEQMVKISFDSSSSNRSSNGLMENCLLEYTAGVGPQWYIGGIDGHQTDNWTVRGNVFKHISSPSGDVAEHAVHFWSDSADTVVENNWIIDCDRGIGFGLGDRGHSGGIIRNNFIYHSSTDYGFADVAIGLENSSNTSVYNNTVYLANSYPNAIEYRWSGTSGGMIRNNLCNKSISSRNGGTATLSNNITNAQAGWFTGVSSGDLHLASEVASVVDQGISISGLTTDFDGDTRPQGSGIDIGADEYVDSSSSPKGTITLSRGGLTFGALTSGVTSGSESFTVSNTGEGALNWSISDNAGWLSCSPTSGSEYGRVTVSVNTSGLSAGSYGGTITVSASNATNSPQTIAVTLNCYNPGGDTAPFGSFDIPAAGSTVRSSIAVSGWALDDTGIGKVEIWRNPVSGETAGLKYIGRALQVEGARPDVESNYPDYPMNSKAGWGYMMLTNFLPNGGNGSYVIHVIATDLGGRSSTLDSRTITCDNANAVKPFGAIDTPAPGEVISGGSYRNWGWVLTPPPNTIPTGGSTIDVYVDGILQGHPVYNLYRSDIAGYFPGYNNSNGAIGYFDVNTLGHRNGVVQFYWTAQDDAGNADGIGSRYVTIDNAGGPPGAPTRGAPGGGSPWTPNYPSGRDLGMAVYDEGIASFNWPVRVVRGFEGREEARLYYPGENGEIELRTPLLRRLVIEVGDGFLGAYSESGGKIRALPVGSSFRADEGCFYWIPGPGFLGEYTLVFIKPGPGGLQKLEIKITIVPGTQENSKDSRKNENRIRDLIELEQLAGHTALP